MSAAANIPTGVLSQQLADAIADRRVRAAVFTTFTFDPGFFELHILPLLFHQSFSQVDKLRRIQLEDAMRSVEHMAVYYDRNALAQNAQPAGLDYRRIDVSRATGGCFHPKVAFLLVDDPTNAGDKDDFPKSFPSLIVAVMSANLTRAGWWENLECAHIEEVKDRDWRDVRRGEKSRPRRCPWRRDALALIGRISKSVDPKEDQRALGTIHRYLRDRTNRRPFRHTTSGGRHHTRLFCGHRGMRFVDWLAEARLYQGWNLEVISPYYDAHGAGPLPELIDLLQPREVRIFLPREHDGTATLEQTTYQAVAEHAQWSELAPDLTARGRDPTSTKLPPRRVHAKVYRLWHKRDGEVIIVGSVNLTEAAHSRSEAGNLEAAFLVDVTTHGIRRWWLRPIETEPAAFAETPAQEDDGLQPAPIDLSLSYDWASGELTYRLGTAGVSGFEVCDTTGGALFEVKRPRGNRWVRAPGDAADKVRQLLLGTSFLLIKHRRGSWRVLVREEHMGHKPALLAQLTAEEILQYWSLLTPEQRAHFIERHLAMGESLEGILLGGGEKPLERKTLFDRFAGIYHAFGCLRRHAADAIEEGREREAETRLLGAKYDSLPSLLEKSLEKEDEDPIIRYVTFLCARQVRDLLASEYRPFFRARRKRTAHLDALLEQLPRVRAALPVEEIGGADFLDWYEDAFLQPAQPEEVDA